MQSEHEGRALLVAMSSLQNALGMEDRQKQVVSSLSVFNSKKTEDDAIESRLLLGMTCLDGIEDVSEQEGSDAGSDANSSMGAIPEVNSDDSQDETRNDDGQSLYASTMAPIKRSTTDTNQMQPQGNKPKMQRSQTNVPSSIQEESAIEVTSNIVDDLTTPKIVRDAEFIEDWPTRFKMANYSNEQIRVVQKALSKIEEWNAMKANESLWINQVQETKGPGLNVSYHTSPRGYNVLKATGVLPHHVDWCFKTLADGEARLKYDVNIQETSFIKKIAVNTYVGYQKSKKIVIVSERDFVIVQHFVRHKNGDMQIVVFADSEYENLVPADKSRAVRGSVYVGGWYFEKMSEEQTRATLILEIDIQGRVPQWVIKQSNTQQGAQINKLPDVIEQFKRDNQ